MYNESNFRVLNIEYFMHTLDKIDR